MILEGLVTTLHADGGTNISPMGPIVDPDVHHLVLRPYQTSTTYRNLKRTGHGVFHVTDDVQLLAQAAIGAIDPLPAMIPAATIQGNILAGVCRWYAFRVIELDDRQERTRIECQVVERGRLRDFFGFNRAKHAVVETAILATRTAILPAEEILAQLPPLNVLVEKTGGPAERRAFDLLEAYIRRMLAGPSSNPTA